MTRGFYEPKVGDPVLIAGGVAAKVIETNVKEGRALCSFLRRGYCYITGNKDYRKEALWIEFPRIRRREAIEGEENWL